MVCTIRLYGQGGRDRRGIPRWQVPPGTGDQLRRGIQDSLTRLRTADRSVFARLVRTLRKGIGIFLGDSSFDRCTDAEDYPWRNGGNDVAVERRHDRRTRNELHQCEVPRGEGEPCKQQARARYLVY